MQELDPRVRDVFLLVLEEIEKNQRERVTKDEFLELKAVVAELASNVATLAQAQTRTEERLSRVEKAIEELAQAQKKTEERLEKLIEEHKKTREHLGGLTHTVGYRLEDEAIWALPALLKRDFGIEVIGQLKRDFIEISSSKYVEVNIWGEGV